MPSPMKRVIGMWPKPSPRTLSSATMLAKRYGGEFLRDYVSDVLKFGPDIPMYGSFDMPTWGQIFLYKGNFNKKVVQKRIKNLCDYLVSLQEK